MKSLPNEARTQNVSGREFCRYCDNEGYVLAQLRPVDKTVTNPRPSTEGRFEELGPCPFCEKGVRIEFQEGSPWGPDGFWQGREFQELEPHSSAQGWKPATGPVARQLLAELGAAIGVPMQTVVDGAAAVSGPSTPTVPPADPTGTSSSPGGGFGTVPE